MVTTLEAPKATITDPKTGHSYQAKTEILPADKPKPSEVLANLSPEVKAEIEKKAEGTLAAELAKPIDTPKLPNLLTKGFLVGLTDAITGKMPEDKDFTAALDKRFGKDFDVKQLGNPQFYRDLLKLCFDTAMSKPKDMIKQALAIKPDLIETAKQDPIMKGLTDVQVQDKMIELMKDEKFTSDVSASLIPKVDKYIEPFAKFMGGFIGVVEKAKGFTESLGIKLKVKDAVKTLINTAEPVLKMLKTPFVGSLKQVANAIPV